MAELGLSSTLLGLFWFGLFPCLRKEMVVRLPVRKNSRGEDLAGKKPSRKKLAGKRPGGKRPTTGIT